MCDSYTWCWCLCDGLMNVALDNWQPGDHSIDNNKNVKSAKCRKVCNLSSVGNPCRASPTHDNPSQRAEQLYLNSSAACLSSLSATRGQTTVLSSSLATAGGCFDWKRSWGCRTTGGVPVWAVWGPYQARKRLTVT